jgi:integrase
MHVPYCPIAARLFTQPPQALATANTANAASPRPPATNVAAPAATVSLGEETDTKTRQHRTVRLLAALAADLCTWRMAAGRPGGGELVFPAKDGLPWTQAAYQSWRRRAFRRAAEAAGLERARPYDLRHSFASLLLHEGRSVIYLARQLGHDARLTLTRYGHVLDELEDTPQMDAEAAIAEARRAAGSNEPGSDPAEL